MNFNAATFLDVSNMSARQVQRLGHEDDVLRDDIDHLPRVALRQRPAHADQAALANGHPVHAWVRELEQAAGRFGIRRDSFAAGKAETCNDIAGKLQRFGSFASDKQAEFAFKLIGWSVPRGAAHPLEGTAEAASGPVEAPQPVQAPQAPAAPAPVLLPRLFDLMQRLSKLEIGDVKLARKNQDSLVWVKLPGVDGVVGKIEGEASLSLFTAKLNHAGRSREAILAALLAIEADPEAAAVLHGKASGRCAVCSRDLTDPESIERGIGPICIGKF
jgi:hypothetical protein